MWGIGKGEPVSLAARFGPDLTEPGKQSRILWPLGPAKTRRVVSHQSTRSADTSFQFHRERGILDFVVSLAVCACLQTTRRHLLETKVPLESGSALVLSTNLYRIATLSVCRLVKRMNQMASAAVDFISLDWTGRNELNEMSPTPTPRTTASALVSSVASLTEYCRSLGG